jgi:iron-sulfur cluster repair protein YtfE (RIC family)
MAPNRDAVRAELLAQHEGLIVLLRLAEDAGRRLLAGAFVEVELEERLTALRNALEYHNQRELALLGPLLAELDQRGPRLVSRMLEEHIEEHELFFERLRGPAREVATRLPELAELLEAHMMAEERTFLSPEVHRAFGAHELN